MDCKDLMVGDWFKAVDYNSPFRITAIYDDVVQTQADYQSEIDGNWYSEAYIKDLVPIKLTEEILVKNGFVQAVQCYSIVGEQQAVGCGTDFYYIDVFNCRTVSIKCVKGLLGLEIHYVHQLQHLLRLCGVEKELVID